MSVPENTPPNTDIGAPIAATDRDGDTLTYTLEGTDADSFDILSTSDGGQIRTSTELNHEEKSSYSVTVRVDGRQGRHRRCQRDDQGDGRWTAKLLVHRWNRL